MFASIRNSMVAAGLAVTLLSGFGPVIAANEIEMEQQTPATVHTIEIHKFKFSMPELEVKVGDEVIWINKDVVPHTATALDKSWDSSRLKKGESFTLKITEDMSLEYFCLYHRQMKATFILSSSEQK